MGLVVAPAGAPSSPVTAPVWLTEGIAEYVAHGGLPEMLPASAIDAARAGTVELAANSLFYRGDDGDNGPNYAAAWWALKYLASVKGPGDPSGCWRHSATSVTGSTRTSRRTGRAT